MNQIDIDWRIHHKIELDKNCPWGFPKRNGDNGKRVRDIGDIYDNYGIKILMIITLFMTYSWFR